MSILGGSRGAAESFGGQSFFEAARQRVPRPNMVHFESAVYYTLAVLAVAGAAVWDYVNTTRARDAAAARSAEDAAIVAEQKAAETGVIDAITGGRSVTFAGGIIPSGDMCLLDPIVHGRWYVLISRARQDDPASIQAFAVGLLDETTPPDMQTTPTNWDPLKRSFVVGSPDSVYRGLAIGVGLPKSETDC